MLKDRRTTYNHSYPDHAPAPRTNYYDTPCLQWRNFRTIRMKPAPHRVNQFDKPPGLGMGSMVSDNWYRFHLGHLTKPTIFAEPTEGKGVEGGSKDISQIDDIADIAKSATLVSTNKAFYKKIPMIRAKPEPTCGVARPNVSAPVVPLVDGIPRLSRMPRCTRERRLPGYAGYIPNTPISRPFTPPADHGATTNTAHKKFPVDEMEYSVFAKSGALSRHVTLTYPFNPFNKVH